jgi:hypothetical protein
MAGNAVTAQDFEDEYTWLRHSLLRLQTILRYAKDESGLRADIAESEKRLEQLEARRRKNAPSELNAAD